MTNYTFPVTRTTMPRPRPEDPANPGFAKYFTDHIFVMDYDEGQGWHHGRIVPHQPFLIEPASSVLHYAQTAFEGMKAYAAPDGSIQLFRPDMNAARMERTCERLCIPSLPEGAFIAAIEQLIKVDADWMPTGANTSLYIRPFIFANQSTISVGPANKYCFMIFLTPTGSYYAENSNGLSTAPIFVEDEYIRAAPGGTGYAKVGGNYAGGMRAIVTAKAHGCNDVLWLDAMEHKYVEEIGTSNAFFVIDGEVITAPLTSGTILPGITRDSVIKLLTRWGYKVSERRLAIEDVLTAAKDGRLTEVFATGTAAVISPIGRLTYKEEDYHISEGKVGPISQRVYDDLYGIQTGAVEDYMGWTYKVEL